MWPVIVIFLAFVCVILLAAAICWLWDLVRFGPQKPWTQDDHEEFDWRLLNPDFATVARHFGCKIPTAIRDLYDSESILKKNFLIRPTNAAEAVEEFFVSYFVPADMQGMESWWPAEEKKFILADTGCRDPYFVELSLESDELSVYVFYHDRGDTLRVADSLREFVALCKRGRPVA